MRTDGFLGYARVSTPQQDTAPQLVAMRDECKRRGWLLLDVIEERASAGATLQRPGFRAALDRIEAGEASGLVVAHLDRVTRSFMDLADVLGWFSARRDVSLIAIDLGIDTSRPDGRLVAQVVGAVAEWERAMIATRTREGLAARRAQGRPTGRPAVADKPELCARIRAMHSGGMTLSAIARRLNAEKVPTLRGAAEWRPSSVQTACGYRRPPRPVR